MKYWPNYIIRPSLRHIEPLLVMGTFAASSIFTIAVAFVLPAPVYGEMMAIQAGVLIISSLLTCRTFDLFFFLTTVHNYEAPVSFRQSICIEIVTGIFMVTIPTIVASLLPDIDFGTPNAGFFAAYSVLIALGAAQGASMASLRFSERSKFIILADSVCLLAWIAAFAAVIFGSVREPLLILLLSAIAPSLRAISLLCACVFVVVRIEEAPKPTVVNKKIVYSFLLKGQGMNFLKNGTVPTETLIANAFFEPSFVAVYRISRSLVSPTTVFMNFLLQKSYNYILEFGKGIAASEIHRTLGKKWLILSALLALPCASLGAIYLYFRPEVDAIQFTFMFSACYASLLISVYQQSTIAALSVSGNHAILARAYFAYFATLSCGACLLIIAPKLIIFISSIILASLFRAMIIRQSSNK